MINEWEEFCAYTGTVSYTASKKSDTTWLGRFTFATILEFEGMARILSNPGPRIPVSQQGRSGHFG